MRRDVTTLVLALGGAAAWAAHAPAQGFTPNYGGTYQPFVGPVNPNFQSGPPLNPYLNLFIGRNQGINYLQAVRPAIRANLNAPTSAGGPQSFGPRAGFFQPPGGDLDQQLADLAPAPAKGFAPTGHPAGFGNTLGYFGGGAGAGANRPANRPGQQPQTPPPPRR